MSKTPFMPLWVSDFLGDTLDLGPTEVGAYMLLLMAQWNRDGRSLPSDQSKLKRVARCGRNWPKVWGEISRFFDEDEDGVYSKRLRSEHQNVAAKRTANAHNGALGGKAKALKSKEAALANATVSPKRNASIPEPEPERRETNVSLGGGQTPKDILSEVASPEVAAEFIDHRKAMKKPVTELAARKIANKIRGHPDPDAVLNDSIANGWQGVFPEKIKPQLSAFQGGQDGQRRSKGTDKLNAALAAVQGRAGRA